MVSCVSCGKPTETGRVICGECYDAKRLERLAEIFTLDHENRVVVLPVAIDQKIFVIARTRTTGRAVVPCIIANIAVEITADYNRVLRMVGRNDDEDGDCEDYGIWGEEFGSVWFLTREEAETALERTGKNV